ncbi:hypothetical protein NKR23_g10764 [Pleurostoma richardsiae]|uniref:Uncharacterized protein n=1 Tax=Pleurostoma richardsiae TaxID=41990 RepID=A0AA38RJB0_9PEZI|nr:hypothetical protein NKR23_g10764 [Pleurostoma richardsiae]
MKSLIVTLLLGLSNAAVLQPPTIHGKLLPGTALLHRRDPPLNLTAVPNCQPAEAACSALDAEYSCAGTSCWCNLTTEGEGICFNSDDSCSAYRACGTSADCAAGERCFQVTGCACVGLDRACSKVRPAVNGTCSF